MSVDAKKVIARLKGESKRKRATLYLDQELIKDFQALCKKLDISSNKAVEELLREFLESAKKSK